MNLPILSQLGIAGLPPPALEYRFAPPRKFRFDLCWKEILLAVEIEGGTWSVKGGGRHQRAAGYARDLEKYNLATLNGWKIIRVDSRMVRDGRALEVITRAFNTFSKREPVEQ